MYKKFSISVALLGCMLFAQFQSVRAETAAFSPPHLSERGPLVDLVRLVVNNHPRARSVNASLQASSARYQAAGQPLYNPELEVEAERTDVNTTSLGLSQTIDWSDKRGARASAAGDEHDAATAEAESARQGLATELLKALSEYHTADDLNKLGQRRLQLMQQFAAIAEKRQQAGDLNQVELDLAKLAALEANLESAELAARFNDAGQALVTLLGELPAPRTWPMLPQLLPDIQQLDIDTEKLLRGHPAFRSQQARMTAARTSIKLRQRETRPDPTISIRTGREDNETLTGLTLSVPLFVRNNFQAEVTEANANLEKAEQDAKSSWLKLKSHINTSVRRYTLMRSTWSSWLQGGETSLKRRTELLEQLWQAGELGTTDYLIQLKQTLDTQAAATELRGRVWKSWTDWLAASGTIFKWLVIEPTSTTNLTQD